ncbi:MAG: RNA polymerase sigma factor [Ruminiclostridium sp.]|nr:RNA polymerase sigma factor [Ruminiclostridium sp.]
MLTFTLSLIDEPSDREKFNEIYRKYKNMMFYKAMSLLHDEVLAEEAVQESLIKIVKNISKISDVNCSKTKAFIVIIVRNTSLDIIRTEHIGETVPLGDEIIPDVSQDVLEKLVSREGYEKLMSAVSELDDIYRDILTLRYVYGYGNDELAKLLGLSRRTIESRVYRGKKMLIERLEGYFDE